MALKIERNTIPAGLQGAGLAYHRALMRAARLVMEVKRTEVVKRTPKDVGTLRNSIHVDGPISEGRNITVSIVAGGASAPYAIIQHENLTFKHTVGQAKYIESVILEARPTIGADIAALVKNDVS